VRFHCDVNFDPFVYMHENNKTYGSFRASVCQTPDSSRLKTPTQGSLSRCTNSDVRSSHYGPLFAVRPITGRTVRLRLMPPLSFTQHVDFMRDHPEYVAQNNAMAFLSDNGGIEYNLCHCTSFFFPPRT